MSTSGASTAPRWRRRKPTWLTSADSPASTSPRRSVTRGTYPSPFGLTGKRRAPPGRGSSERQRCAIRLLQPLLDRVLVVLHPVGSGLFGVLLVPGDRLRHELLVLVCELHLLQHVVRG